MTNNFTQTGYYRRRDGGVEHISNFNEEESEYPLEGLDTWSVSGELCTGFDNHFDLIEYLGKDNPLDELARLRAEVVNLQRSRNLWMQSHEDLLAALPATGFESRIAELSTREAEVEISELIDPVDRQRFINFHKSNRLIRDLHAALQSRLKGIDYNNVDISEETKLLLEIFYEQVDWGEINHLRGYDRGLAEVVLVAKGLEAVANTVRQSREPVPMDVNDINVADIPAQAAKDELLREAVDTAWVKYKSDMRPETRNDFLRCCSSYYDNRQSPQSTRG